jgi:2,3-bisphosphoglycerate-independent phosphoglycerate mutase
MQARKPHVLIILDGFGYREETDHNAIANARKPHWDALWAKRPHTLVSGSGMDVGLPDGQMGNSEVGHMNLGAGRIVYQDLTRITKAILDGEFQTNPVLCRAVDAATGAGKALHLLGLLSPGGVHSHEDHFIAMIELAAARGARQVFVHAFLDGRDMPPRSALPPLQRIDNHLRHAGLGRIASVCGRYFAMDRDNRWDRVQSAYDLMTLAEATFSSSDAVSALTAAYERGENDEFVKATVIAAEGETPVRISDGDSVIFMNFRADRARQITRAFVVDGFDNFPRRARPALADYVMLTEYAADIPAACAFPPQSLKNTFGEYMASLGKTQLRIAETEKYAHVTFFFSGGREEPWAGEQRCLVPSPKVDTYDLQPEMSAAEVTDRMVEAITGGQYDAIICNFANGDMVGHTGNYDAAVKAVEALDTCLGRIVDALAMVGGECLITADHGNCEMMLDTENQQPHTQHTTDLVPFVYVGPRQLQLRDGGVLSDVAPTLLDLMDLPLPDGMTGTSLIRKV